MATTTLSMLRRESVVVPDSVESLARDVMHDVHNKFGYSRLRSVAREADQGRELRAALSALEIQPFARDTVERYKLEMAFVGWRYLGTVSVVLPTLFTLLIVSLVYLAGRDESWVTVSQFVVGAIGALAVFIIFCFMVSPDGRPGGQWRVELLRDTKIDVPLFALQTALAIHDRVPLASVHVDRFRPRGELIFERRQAEMADPFLVVQYGDYEAYVEVWDEPGFESRRKV